MDFFGASDDVYRQKWGRYITRSRIDGGGMELRDSSCKDSTQPTTKTDRHYLRTLDGDEPYTDGNSVLVPHVGELRVSGVGAEVLDRSRRNSRPTSGGRLFCHVRGTQAESSPNPKVL